MLKIRKSLEKQQLVVALGGRLDQEHLPELQALLAAEADAGDITLDLYEVKLVDRESVRFLASCKASGVKLRNCPSYIRKWIEKRRTTYEAIPRTE